MGEGLSIFKLDTTRIENEEVASRDTLRLVRRFYMTADTLLKFGDIESM